MSASPGVPADLPLLIHLGASDLGVLDGAGLGPPGPIPTSLLPGT